MRLRRALLCVVLLLIAVPGFAISSKTEVEDAYYAWCNAIGAAHGDGKTILKFYASDALLLPTLSTKILFNQKHELDAYFATLTSYPDIKCIPQKLITRMENNIAINSGFYTFTYTENGQVKSIPARFSFVYKGTKHHWLIINHHSSMLP